MYRPEKETTSNLAGKPTGAKDVAEKHAPTATEMTQAIPDDDEMHANKDQGDTSRPGVVFGAWKEVEILEFYYQAHLEASEKLRIEAERERARRMETASRMEKSWELIRISKEFIKENSPHWERLKDLKKLEKEKKERLDKANQN